MAAIVGTIAGKLAGTVARQYEEVPWYGKLGIAAVNTLLNPFTYVVIIVVAIVITIILSIWAPCSIRDVKSDKEQTCDGYTSISLNRKTQLSLAISFPLVFVLSTVFSFGAQHVAATVVGKLL